MIVVTDTSVILNLSWLSLESLLPAIFQSILAPEQVKREFERKADTDPRFLGLEFPAFITVADPTIIPSDLSDNADLDPGEIAAIALALERGIADVLVDESYGRAVALAHGLHVSGLLGVLIEGKQRRLIPNLLPLLDRLAAGARFWMHPRLREHVLRIAGEAL